MSQTQRHFMPEPHAQALGAKLNWLRAGVLGANDGIVSTAGVVIGVAAGGASGQTTILAGGAALVAGAVSMALGEYVSVSAQRDTEGALIAKEKAELEAMPGPELDELAELLEKRGLSPELAREAAEELTERDALRAHLEFELAIDPDDLSNPWVAAGSSAVSFTVGALLPLVAVLYGVVPCVVACLVALMITGGVAAKIGHAPILRSMLRLVIGGALGLGLTWLVGNWVGVSV